MFLFEVCALTQCKVKYIQSNAAVTNDVENLKKFPEKTYKSELISDYITSARQTHRHVNSWVLVDGPSAFL